VKLVCDWHFDQWQNWQVYPFEETVSLVLSVLLVIAVIGSLNYWTFAMCIFIAHLPQFLLHCMLFISLNVYYSKFCLHWLHTANERRMQYIERFRDETVLNWIEAVMQMKETCH